MALGNGENTDSTAQRHCVRCDRPFDDRAAYLLGGECRCLQCALRYRPMLRRSAWTAMVVGTILVLINHGGKFIVGDFSPTLAWQVPLTYLVPFCVASWGALGNNRIAAPTESHPDP